MAGCERDGLRAAENTPGSPPGNRTPLPDRGRRQVTTRGFDIYDAHKRYLPASIVETGSLVQCTACSMRRSVLACSMRTKGSQGSRGWWQRVFHDSPGGCDAFGSTTASIGEPVHCSGPWRAMSTLRHTANAKTGHIAQPALSGDGAELRRRSSVGPHRSLHVERGALRAGCAESESLCAREREPSS